MLKQLIHKSLIDAHKELEAFLADPSTLDDIQKAAELMIASLSSGGKIISCGNGGSLCDATHFAEELTGRYRRDRKPLPAMAINDPAYLTCVGNDYSFADVFSRSVEAFGRPGDVLLAISTGGTSENVLEAARSAKELGIKVVALTSVKGKPLDNLADACVKAPDSPYTDRIQEIHIKVIHILIEAIERGLDLG